MSDTFDSNDGDSAHRLTVFENKVDNAIEQIYNQGINPKMYDLSFNVVPNGNTFTTTVSLVINKSDDGKAWTGFASRGSYGFNYEKRADDQITGKGNKDGRSLKEKLESGADAVKIIPISNSPITIRNATVKQYFFQFTKSLKPSHTTPKPNTQPTPQPTPQPNTPETITIEVTGINSFQEEVKAKTSGGTSIDVSSVVFSRTNSTFKVSYSTGETKIDGMTLMIDETSKDNLNDRIKNNIKLRYPNLKRDEKEWQGEVGKWYYEFLILIK